jgi:SAM-dependent methyltransferase
MSTSESKFSPLLIEPQSGLAEDGALPGDAGSPGASDATVPMKIVLNIGCGPLGGLGAQFSGPDWHEVRLDINPEVAPDIVCSITDMDPVAAKSVDAIWSSHNLEHLERHQVPLALAECWRVLRPGGMLVVATPDLQRIAELVAADPLEDAAYVAPSGPITPLDMIYGHTPSLAQGNRYMAHRCGFTPRTLHRLLTEAGFVQVAVAPGGNLFELSATAYRPLP